MISYKDRAWCSRYLFCECINVNCERAFTRQDKDKAIEWWGDENFPLSFSDLYTDKCNYMPKEIE